MFTFKKEERLSSRKQIGELIDKGSSFFLYPFRIVWLEVDTPSTYPAQLLISVSKKRFKRAVDRNRIKRLIREAYRLQKEEALYSWYRSSNKTLLMMVSYTGKTIFTAKEVADKLNNCLLRFREKHEATDAGISAPTDPNL